MIGQKLNKAWRQRNCPICGNAQIFKPEVSSKIPAESMTFNEVREYFIGIRNEQVFFSYHRCQECNVLYCPYYFDGLQLDSLYADMPDNLLGAEKSTAARTQNGYFNWFKSFPDKVNTYLELGPDIGLITKEVIRHFKPSQVTLVEPNSAVHEELSSLQNPQSKIELFRNLYEVSNAEVDLTVGIHVFDHLLNPSEQIQQIRSKTRFGGFIGIVVHNESSLLRKMLGNKWPPFCLQHPQLFNHKTLERLLSVNGFEKCKISRSINHFSIQHIGSMAIDVVGLAAVLKKLLPNIEIPIALGNQISIFKKIS